VGIKSKRGGSRALGADPRRPVAAMGTTTSAGAVPRTSPEAARVSLGRGCERQGRRGKGNLVEKKGEGGEASRASGGVGVGQQHGRAGDGRSGTRR
jgi:hypothetical protein